MNAELEALVLALDAVMEARAGQEAQKFEEKYEAKLQEVLARYPALSRDRLVRAVNGNTLGRRNPLQCRHGLE